MKAPFDLADLIPGLKAWNNGAGIDDIWQAKLNRDFPQRKITVSFPENHEEGLMNYEVAFFQER